MTYHLNFPLSGKSNKAPGRSQKVSDKMSIKFWVFNEDMGDGSQEPKFFPTKAQAEDYIDEKAYQGYEMLRNSSDLMEHWIDVKSVGIAGYGVIVDSDGMAEHEIMLEEKDND